VHNNLKNVVGVLGGITGFDLKFLSSDTSVGLDCADIDDNDTAEDGAVCWDVVSCCENNAIVSASLSWFTDQMMLTFVQSVVKLRLGFCRLRASCLRLMVN
jgi:hypothetical protein